MKEQSKSQMKISKRKVSLELLHQRFGHRSTRSIVSGDAANIKQDIEIKVDPDHFAHHAISPQNTPFKWVFIDIIPATFSKTL